MNSNKKGKKQLILGKWPIFWEENKKIVNWSTKKKEKNLLHPIEVHENTYICTKVIGVENLGLSCRFNALFQFFFVFVTIRTVVFQNVVIIASVKLKLFGYTRKNNITNFCSRAKQTIFLRGLQSLQLCICIQLSSEYVE